MNTKIPEGDPIKAQKRKSVAARRVGANAKCTVCGETRPEALNKKSTSILCEECTRKVEGKTPMDDHHPVGRTNSPITTSIPANDHRAELSAAQYDWPEGVLENRDGCPLLRAAACIRGFIDTAIYHMREFLMWVVDMLVLLSARLIEAWGRRWWLNTEFARFAPNGGSRGKGE